MPRPPEKLRLLQEAIDSLRINDVYLYQGNCKLYPGFDNKLTSDISGLQHQYRNTIVDSSEFIDAVANDEKSVRIFRVYISLGFRWVKADDEELDIKAMIEATFVAEYLVLGKPSDKALEVFATENATFHVWPYWREYAMNQSLRMGLPKAIIPAMQLQLEKQDTSQKKEVVKRENNKKEKSKTKS